MDQPSEWLTSMQIRIWNNLFKHQHCSVLTFCYVFPKWFIIQGQTGLPLLPRFLDKDPQFLLLLISEKHVFFFFLQQSRAIGTSLSRCPQEKITNSVYWVLCLLVFLCFWIPPVNELAYICTFVLITMAYSKTKQFRMAPWKHDLYNN